MRCWHDWARDLKGYTLMNEGLNGSGLSKDSLSGDSAVLDRSSESILKYLATGNFCSGEWLGQTLGISRAAIAKKIKKIRALGLVVHSVKGRGYCLDEPIEWLDKAEVLGELSPTCRDALKDLRCVLSIDSTNSALLQMGALGAGCVLFAETQKAGRGRRGRQWFGGFAKNLLFSMGFCFDGGVKVCEGLSLTVGVAVVNVLEAFGVEGLSLKWPNDILLSGEKLGGILIELSGDFTDQCYAVIGLGLNLDVMISEVQPVEGLRPTSLKAHGYLVDRNRLAAALVSEMFDVLSHFSTDRFVAYQSRWNALNFHHNKPVRLVSHNLEVVGHMLGVSGSGNIRLSVDGVEREYVAGELSLRTM